MTEQQEPTTEQAPVESSTVEQTTLDQTPNDLPVGDQSFGGEWLPSWRQMENALRLRFDSLEDFAVAEDAEAAPVITPDSVYFASMRQGMGMVLLAGLVAGLVPFLWNWFTSARYGTVVPLASMGDATSSMFSSQVMDPNNPIAAALQTIAGLSPAVFPGWLASFVSSFGLWLNTPLSWLSGWLVYGLLVLLVAKALGAGTTLQQFYTVTSFAYLPLILTAFAPIPCLGSILVLAALVWAAAIYTVALRSVSGLSTGMSVLSVILPGITIALLAILVTTIAVASVVSALF